MKCWKCAKLVSEEAVKIGFRATCPHCGIDLHTCANCRYYAPGKPNDCAVPGTDFVRDRETANFCEDFKVQLESSSPSILRPLKKCEICQGGRPDFGSGEAGAEDAKLKKFSAAGGAQKQWLSDAGRFTLFEREQYNRNEKKKKFTSLFKEEDD